MAPQWEEPGDPLRDGEGQGLTLARPRELRLSRVPVWGESTWPTRLLGTGLRGLIFGMILPSDWILRRKSTDLNPYTKRQVP